MINFEERALDELKALAADTAAAGGPATEPPPATATSRRGRRALYGLAASAVLASGIGLGAPLFSGSSAEAQPFEVVKRPDGGILFKVDEFRNPKGLEQRLRDLGLPAVVDYVPYGRKCAPGRFAPHAIADDDLNAIYHWLPEPTDRRMTDKELEFYSQLWTEVRPELMPANTTLVITVTMTQTLAKDVPDPGYRDGRRAYASDSTGSTSTYRLADGPVAACTLIDDPTARGPATDNGPTVPPPTRASTTPARPAPMR
ncbi:hypothetical protein [Embleya sp. NPDC059259]|uniref:hypothetical protein n=1 Tax=unclassified Embleya TaxID=2699296 RepID=UPI0036900067